jgi:hypothetical protein
MQQPPSAQNPQAVEAAAILRTLRAPQPEIGHLPGDGWKGFRPEIPIRDGSWTPLPFWEILYLAQRIRAGGKPPVRHKGGCLSGTGAEFLDLMHSLGGNQYVECRENADSIGEAMEGWPGMVWGHLPPGCPEGLACELWHHRDDTLIPLQRHALYWHLRWARPADPGHSRGPRVILDLADWGDYCRMLAGYDGDRRTGKGCVVLSGLAYLGACPWYRLTPRGLDWLEAGGQAGAPDAGRAEGLPEPLKGKSNGGCVFVMATVRDITGLGNGAINRYAQKAGVRIAGRGKRDFTWTGTEVRQILNSIISESSSQADREKASKALERLQ